MTKYDKAGSIVHDGKISQTDFDEFVKNTESDVIQYIALFDCFGVSQADIWQLWEDRPYDNELE